MKNKEKGEGIVAYDGVCLICGSTDGMIVKCNDKRYRVICRVISCPAHYQPAPAIGYNLLEEAQKWEKGYNVLTGGDDKVKLTYQQYLYGE